jgi:hypothetical protein
MRKSNDGTLYNDELSVLFWSTHCRSLQESMESSYAFKYQYLSLQSPKKSPLHLNIKQEAGL